MNVESAMSPVDQVAQIYQGIESLRRAFGEVRLSDCTGRLPHLWPTRGIYLFFEVDEVRADGTTPRVVRVGTHAVSAGSSTTLWNRLRTHRGAGSGAGNHRSSIFRHHVGTALLRAGRASADLADIWSAKKVARPALEREKPLEIAVSRHIGAMHVIWLAIDDVPGPTSKRAFLERNLIALLSSDIGRQDRPSSSWLGRHALPMEVRTSGLWNISHVGAQPDRRAVSTFLEAVRQTVRRP